MKYFSLILIGLLFSCNRNTEPSNTTHPDVTRIDTIACAPEYDTPLDSIIEKIDYVKLRSTENNPIGEVDALWITPDNIVVADYNLSKSIFIFDRLGRLQATISRLGRGPQEYLSISDVTLTPDRQRVAVLDNHGKKILYYDLAGNFLFRKELPFYPLHMRYLDEENILLTTYGLEEKDPGLASYAHNKDLLYCMDTTMQIRKSFMPNQFSEELSSWCSPNIKQFDDGRVYATHVYSDTVYQVTPEGLIARYWIDLSPVGGVANFWHGLTKEKLMSMQEQTKFGGEFLENDRFAFFRILGSEPTILHSKKSGKNYYLSNRSFTVLGGYVRTVTFAYGDQFIKVVPAYRLSKVEEYVDQTYMDLAKEIATDLNEDDDPVLLFFTLKEPDTPAID